MDNNKRMKSEKDNYERIFEKKKQKTQSFTSIVLIMIIIFRFNIFYLLRTSYHPDEYYQSIEPAMSLFSQNYFKTWEWLPDYRLRSFLSLLPMSTFYQIARVVSIDVNMLWIGRFTQTILSIISDYCFYLFCKNERDVGFANISLFIHLTTWFYLFCASRTLINVLEMNLIIISLFFRSNYYQYPEHFVYSLLGFSVISCICLYIRPTSLLLLGLVMLTTIKNHISHILSFLIIGLIIGGLGIFLDSSFYHVITCTPFQFFLINILQQKANVFGTHAWHWAFSNGIPTILGLYFPLYILSWCFSFRNQTLKIYQISSILFPILFVLFTKHQEHRFLLPLLPFLSISIGNFIFDSFLQLKTSKYAKWILSYTIFAAFLHVLIACYLLYFHQSGTEVSMKYLQSFLQLSNNHKYQENQRNFYSTDSSVLILLAGPCYSFPGYGILTEQFQQKFRPQIIQLNCSLPWEYHDPFLHQPSEGFQQLFQYVNSTFPNPSKEHVYLLTFDSYLPYLKPYFLDNQFHLIASFLHAHFRYDYDDHYPKTRVYLYYLRPENFHSNINRSELVNND